MPKANNKYLLDEALSKLNVGKYLISYNFKERVNNKTSKTGHTTCIFKDRKNRIVVLDRMAGEKIDCLPFVDYYLNDHPDVDNQQIKREKIYKISNI